MKSRDQFSPEVGKSLKYYVYRLIDPRNGETFYIGKGKNNRVFDHANGDIKDGEYGAKLERIRKIRNSQLLVNHIIHRHGMDEKTVFEVEAELIDAYPGLTNIADGQGNSDFGSMHSKEVIRRYEAPIMEFKHKALLISVNKTAAMDSLYEATRYAWKISKANAKKAEIVIATVQGLGIGVFIVDEWLKATTDNFPGREAVEGRFGFIGREAPKKICDLYVGKRTPVKYRKKGASNPIKYAY